MEQQFPVGLSLNGRKKLIANMCQASQLWTEDDFVRKYINRKKTRRDLLIG